MLGDKEVCATIAVRDLAAAEKFYGNTLGLEKGMASPGGTFYKSGAGGIFIYPSQYAGSNKATYAAWSVGDVEAEVEALKAKGVKFEHYDDIPGATLKGDVHVMGELKSAWFKDPDGNILNIVNQEM